VNSANLPSEKNKATNAPKKICGYFVYKILIVQDKMENEYAGCRGNCQRNPSYIAVMLNMMDYAGGISFALHFLHPSYAVQSSHFTLSILRVPLAR